jgi:hypothetical protein
MAESLTHSTTGHDAGDQVRAVALDADSSHRSGLLSASSAEYWLAPVPPCSPAFGMTSAARL